MRAKDFYRIIEGTYPSYRAFVRALLDQFNKNLDHLSPNYAYTQLVDWGQKNHWWFQDKSGQVTVRVE